METKQNFRTEKKIVPIDHIVPNRWNPNVQSKQMFEKGKQSVEELGMLGSILVRETGGMYEILDGEHRWKYLKELNYKECPVESMGEIDDTQAQLLTVLINNIHGKDDIERRAKIFEALDAGQTAMLPWSAEEIENEKSLFKFDFSQYDKKEEVEKKDTNSLIQIVVPQEVKDLWNKCLKIAQQDDISPVQLFVGMLENFIALNKGQAPGQREQVL